MWRRWVAAYLAIGLGWCVIVNVLADQHGTMSFLGVLFSHVRWPLKAQLLFWTGVAPVLLWPIHIVLLARR